LKRAGIRCEYVSEYAKDIVWEGTTALLDNQLHIFSEQFRRQWRLLGKVDYVITDSPILLSCIYFKNYAHKRSTFPPHYLWLTTQYFLETYKLFDNINVHITRNKNYDPVGRMQTEEEARAIDKEIEDFLNEYTSGCSILTDSQNAIDDIVDHIKERHVSE
jgi:hypothetical protein